jgi:uncharacterized protein YegL
MRCRIGFYFDMDMSFNREFALLIDTSSSMRLEDGTGKSRLQRAKELTIGLAYYLIDYDQNGIDLYTFASTVKVEPAVTPARVEEVFAKIKPWGGTKLDLALDEIGKIFLEEAKSGAYSQASGKSGMTIFVITDGEPDDPRAVTKKILELANSVGDSDILRIQVLTIADDNTDEGKAVNAYWQKMDDDLKKNGLTANDIIDVKPFAVAAAMDPETLLTEAQKG